MNLDGPRRGKIYRVDVHNWFELSAVDYSRRVRTG